MVEMQQSVSTVETWVMYGTNMTSVKSQINLRKHCISIPELGTIFKDPNTILDMPDETHSLFEDRFYAYGRTSTGKYVIAWYTRKGKL